MEGLKSGWVVLMVLTFSVFFFAVCGSSLLAEEATKEAETRAAEVTMNELLPNGSFEWIEHLFPAWLEHNKGRFEIPGNDPVLPVTWSLDKPGKFITESKSGSSHSGKYAFTIIPGPLTPGALWRETQISCGWIDVERQVTYYLSGFARGKGNFHMYIDTEVPEGIKGWKEYANVELTDSWQEVSFSPIQFPGNVSRIRILICIVAPKESGEGYFAAIDDFSLKTTGKVTSTLPALNSPPESDENTTLLEHFEDKVSPKGSVIQPVNFIEGRFGKGIYLGPDGVIEYPNDNIMNPNSGTVEFWLKPNENPSSCDIQILVNDDFRWTYNTGGVYPKGRESFVISWKRRPEIWREIKTDRGREGKGDPKPSRWDLLDRSSEREWHHIALCWDETSMLLYVDGLLVGVDEMGKPAGIVGPQLIFGNAAEALKDRTPNIGIDELRISKNRRYGTVQSQPIY